MEPLSWRVRGLGTASTSTSTGGDCGRPIDALKQRRRSWWNGRATSGTSRPETAGSSSQPRSASDDSDLLRDRGGSDERSGRPGNRRIRNLELLPPSANRKTGVWHDIVAPWSPPCSRRLPRHDRLRHRIANGSARLTGRVVVPGRVQRPHAGSVGRADLRGADRGARRHHRRPATIARLSDLSDAATITGPCVAAAETWQPLPPVGFPSPTAGTNVRDPPRSGVVRARVAPPVRSGSVRSDGGSAAAAAAPHRPVTTSQEDAMSSGLSVTCSVTVGSQRAVRGGCCLTLKLPERAALWVCRE